MFQGFSPETVDFLWGIRLNNNREWFMAHKAEYQKFLYEPMKLLAQDVFAAFQDVPNMDHKLSRIYKDARMHPAVPYKESLWFVMRPEGYSWSEQPSLYFEIRPEGFHYGFVLWSPKTAVMERYRKRLADYPEEYPALVKAAERATGILLDGDEYSRKKSCPHEILEPYYNRKNIKFVTTGEPGDLMFSPKLADQVIDTLKKLYPLYEYCLKFSLDG